MLQQWKQNSLQFSTHVSNIFIWLSAVYVAYNETIFGASSCKEQVIKCMKNVKV